MTWVVWRWKRSWGSWTGGSPRRRTWCCRGGLSYANLVGRPPSCVREGRWFGGSKGEDTGRLGQLDKGGILGGNTTHAGDGSPLISRRPLLRGPLAGAAATAV